MAFGTETYGTVASGSTGLIGRGLNVIRAAVRLARRITRKVKL